MGNLSVYFVGHLTQSRHVLRYFWISVPVWFEANLLRGPNLSLRRHLRLHFSQPALLPIHVHVPIARNAHASRVYGGARRVL